MKKKSSQILGTVVAVSLLSSTPVWAKPNEQHTEHGRQAASISIKKIPGEMMKALENLYLLLPELKDLKVTNAEIRENDEGDLSKWSFSFKNIRNWESDTLISARVTIEPETGTLLEYDMESYNGGPKNPLPEKEAKEIADKFLKNALGDKIKLYRAVEGNANASWDDEGDEGKTERLFTYELVMNGIAVRGMNVKVYIDAEGQITRYTNQPGSVITDASVFPAPQKTMSKRKAQAAYLGLLDMQPSYEPNQRVAGKQKGPVLKYTPSYSGPIDAFTGKKVEEDKENGGPIQSEKIALSPEGKPIFATSLDEAKKLLENKVGIDLAKADFSVSTDDKNSCTYRYFQPYMTARVSTDVKTGQVLSVEYRFADEKEDESKRFKPDDATAAAVKHLEKWLPQDAKEVVVTYRSESSFGYSFDFQPTHQGVTVGSSPYEISFDAKGNLTKLVVDLQTDFTTLPDKRKIISAKQAAKAFIKKNDLTLAYMLEQGDNDKTDEQWKLYYVPTYKGRDSYIDAFTGDFIKR